MAANTGRIENDILKRASRAVIFWGFAASGFAGLIYEVIWQRSLTNIIGATVQTSTIIIAAFMSGLGIGSYLVGARVMKSDRLLDLFAALQLGVGLFGIATFFLVREIDKIFNLALSILSMSETTSTLVQLVVSFIIIMLPAIFMGGSFPVINKAWSGGFERLPKDAGNIYAINTWGAAFGALAAGFVLVPMIGLSNANSMAVMINFGVAATAFFLARQLSANK